jgi:hypothetical protein
MNTDSYLEFRAKVPTISVERIRSYYKFIASEMDLDKWVDRNIEFAQVMADMDELLEKLEEEKKNFT